MYLLPFFIDLCNINRKFSEMGVDFRRGVMKNTPYVVSITLDSFIGLSYMSM